MKTKYFLAVAILTVAVFCVSVPAETHAAGCMLQFSSLSVSDKISCLQQAISDLMAQIAQLQGQQSGQTWCHTFNTNLGVGSSGDEIAQLHTALQKNGLYPSDNFGFATVDFDEDTAAHVVQFQAKYGIIQTGFVGPLTRGKLNSLYGCNNTTPPTPSSLTVTSPSAGQHFNEDDTIIVNWTPSNSNIYEVDLSPVIASNLTFRISGGKLTQPNTSGSASYKIDNTVPSGSYYITLYYTSDGSKWVKSQTFNITTSYVPPTPTAQPSITITSPSGGETWQTGGTYTITWNSKGVGKISDISAVSSGMDFSVHGDFGYKINSIVKNIDASSGSYSWTIPTNISFDKYNRISITAIPTGCESGGCGGPVIANSNNFNISYSTSSVSLISPNGGEQFIQGKPYDIKWSSVNVDKIYSILLMDYSQPTVGSRTIYWSTDAGLNSNTGNYSWTVPSDLAIGSKYKIFISSSPYKLQGSYDESANYFSVISANTPASMTIVSVSPMSNGKCLIGNQFSCNTVSWTGNGLGTDWSKYKVELYKSGNFYASMSNFSGGLFTTNGSLAWNTPPSNVVVGSDYQIKVTDGLTNTSALSNYFSMVTSY